MFNLKMFSLPTLLAAGLSLSAMTTPPDPPDSDTMPLRYGVQLVGAVPRQTLQTAGLRTGLGIGLFAESDPAPGTTLQTWIEFIRYPQTNNPPQGVLPDYLDPDALTLAANTLSLGVDARVHLPRPRLRRVFVMAGVLASRFEFQSSRTVVAADSSGALASQTLRRAESTPFKLGLSVGAGIDLHENVTLTLRYSHVGLPGINLDTLETGLGFKF